MAQTRYTGDAKWHMPALNYTLKFDLPAPAAAASADSKQCLSLVLTDTCPYITEYRDPGKYAKYPWFEKNLEASNPAALLEWMKAEIAAASQACVAVFVVGHHPIYSGGEHGDHNELITQFKPILDQNNVDLYIAGHDHTLFHLREVDASTGKPRPSSVDYILTGAGSDVRSDSQPTKETIFYDDTAGFTFHSVNGTHTLTTFVRYDGLPLHQSLVRLKSKGKGLLLFPESERQR